MGKRDWTQARAKVDREAACRVCGANQGIQAAHIIPRSRVGPGAGEVAENICPLCQDCHTAYDSHSLDLLPYLTREEQGTAAFLVGLAEAVRRICGRHADLGD